MGKISLGVNMEFIRHMTNLSPGGLRKRPKLVMNISSPWCIGAVSS